MTALFPAYFDTSVLVKRYIREPGSEKARALLRRYPVLSSAVAPLEIVSAVYRLHSIGSLPKEGLSAILEQVREDRATWQLIEVSPLILSRAERVVAAAGVRSLDAIHLASALFSAEARGTPTLFITADAHQRVAASLLQMEVVSVE